MAREPELWKGPSREDVLRRFAPYVIRYSDWYAENGMYLPEEYASDPGAWTEILRKMEAGFELLRERESQELSAYEREQIEEATRLFYKYIEHLWRV